MHNIKNLLYKLLNTPPYQLPPVIHTGGTYSLDLQYRGKSLLFVGNNLHECLTRYLDFVVAVNDSQRFRREDFDKIPVPYGQPIEGPYWIDPSRIESVNEIQRFRNEIFGRRPSAYGQVDLAPYSTERPVTTINELKPSKPKPK